MELVDGTLTLEQHEENKWFFFESGINYDNDITSVRFSEKKIYVQFLGGEFEQPTIIWFDFSQEAFNEMWQYEFRDNYRYSLSRGSFTLWGINDIASICYTALNDLSYL